MHRLPRSTDASRGVRPARRGDEAAPALLGWGDRGASGPRPSPPPSPAGGAPPRQRASALARWGRACSRGSIAAERIPLGPRSAADPGLSAPGVRGPRGACFGESGDAPGGAVLARGGHPHGQFSGRRGAARRAPGRPGAASGLPAGGRGARWRGAGWGPVVAPAAGGATPPLAAPTPAARRGRAVVRDARVESAAGRRQGWGAGGAAGPALTARQGNLGAGRPALDRAPFPSRGGRGADKPVKNPLVRSYPPLLRTTHRFVD